MIIGNNMVKNSNWQKTTSCYLKTWTRAVTRDCLEIECCSLRFGIQSPCHTLTSLDGRVEG